MTRGYQLTLDGLFPDERTVTNLADNCCDGDDYHVPHCPTYLAEIAAIDAARDCALSKHPSRDLPMRTIGHLNITVAGTPAPQGSKDAFPIYEGTGPTRRFTGKVTLVEVADKAVRAWRRAVNHACREHRNAFPRYAPLHVECLFSIARPPSIDPAARKAPVVRPDADKYLRGTLDALVIAEVFPDDAQVLRCTGEKNYAGQGRGPTQPGAHITISRVLL